LNLELGTLNSYAYAYDANGNVTGLVDTNGAVAAQYEYDPYGNTMSATDIASTNNPLRFSTRYADDESRLVYYGRRYYQSESGRWLSFDPAGEWGGWNLYAFVANDGIGRWDYLGLNSLGVCTKDGEEYLVPGEYKCGLCMTIYIFDNGMIEACGLFSDTTYWVGTIEAAKQILNKHCAEGEILSVAIAALVIDAGGRNPDQDKKVSTSTAKDLAESVGYDSVEDLKEDYGAKPPAHFDIFKGEDGNYYIKPKDGSGPGEPVGTCSGDD